MNIKTSWLISLLVLQLILAAVLFYFNQSDPYQEASKALLTFSKESVDKLKITGESNEVELKKETNKWRLPRLHNLPVNQLMVDNLLLSLSELKTNWPVATTSSSHERFEVTNDKFQRKVQLFEQDKEADVLLLGTSPGFKKNHLRVANNDNVYALKINTYDLPTKLDDWLDKNLLALNNVSGISGKDFALVNDNNEWKFVTESEVDAGSSSDSKTDLQVDQNKANELVNSLSSLRVTSVVNKDTLEEFSFNATSSIEVNTLASQRYIFELMKQDEKHYIKRSDHEPIFEILENDFKKLHQLNLSSLTKVTEKGASSEFKEPEKKELNIDN